MYSAMQIDEKDYYVKPMNCTFHIELYQSRLRSYRLTCPITRPGEALCP